MIKITLITLLVALVLFEIIEHALVPLVGFILTKRRASISGAESMVGKIAEVTMWKTTEGLVFVNGEIWRAVCRVPLARGEKAMIQQVEGLTLKVEPIKGEPE